MTISVWEAELSSPRKSTQSRVHMCVHWQMEEEAEPPQALPTHPSVGGDGPPALPGALA